ncbi:hypothetical protein SLEP1_g18005 [Rubroshorea leprosula]|uniref:Uncharacterized protein n=1 Tax=Rubroshorea leprosula TaxID=152421 RepID=A0AAV5J1Z4_9ROSI|nr:hypothetical protein SLEP1_g18005 [Rubroshorea leprosula]
MTNHGWLAVLEWKDLADVLVQSMVTSVKEKPVAIFWKPLVWKADEFWNEFGVSLLPGLLKGHVIHNFNPINCEDAMVLSLPEMGSTLLLRLLSIYEAIMFIGVFICPSKVVFLSASCLEITFLKLNVGLRLRPGLRAYYLLLGLI